MRSMESFIPEPRWMFQIYADRRHVDWLEFDVVVAPLGVFIQAPVVVEGKTYFVSLPHQDSGMVLPGVALGPTLEYVQDLFGFYSLLPETFVI